MGESVAMMSINTEAAYLRNKKNRRKCYANDVKYIGIAT